MNQATLVFPNQNNGITIRNPYNDASMRNIFYTGSLINPSDPAFKEQIESANLSMCYTTLANLPLRSYSYSEPFVSTFHVRDRRRLGFITSEVSPILPHAVTEIPFEAWLSSIHTLDTSQIRYTHLGVTQSLIQRISTLEAIANRQKEELRRMVAQRNTVL
jgi:hypothetical protein